MCCRIGCGSYTHKLWFSRGSGDKRVWCGSEHRSVYIPYKGETDWTFHQPSATHETLKGGVVLTKASTTLNYSKWDRIDDSDDDSNDSA